MDLPDDRQNTRGKWRIEKGKLIRSWRFTGESADTTSVDEISDLNQKILKFRMISEEGPGKPEGIVLPTEFFTSTRVKEKK